MVTDQIKKLIIYTDGGSRGNPGPAAIGVVFKDENGKTLKSYGEYLGVKTNNEAEYEAVIFALKKAKALFGKKNTKIMNLDIHVDSQLLAKQLNGEYKIEDEKMQGLFIKIWNLKMDFGSVSFHHIFREENKEADKLVNQVLDKQEQKLL